MIRVVIANKFWSKVEKSDGCWMWNGQIHPHGYGHFKIEGRTKQAHRVAYELLVGPIPDGLVIDHLCRNRACVNPAHMEPVTIIENVRRSNAGKQQAERTHCPQGHPYNEENTRTHKGKRYCRVCQRDRMRVRRGASA